MQANGICQRAIVTLRPDLVIVTCVDQLHVDHDAIGGTTDAALKDMRDPERLSDLAQFTTHGRTPISHDRRARDDSEFFDLAQGGQDIVLYAIGEEGVIFFRAHIFKRQNGDALFRDGRGLCCRCARNGRR